MRKILCLIFGVLLTLSSFTVCALDTPYEGVVDTGLDYSEAVTYLENPMNAMPHCQFITVDPEGSFSLDTPAGFCQYFFDMRLFSGGYTCVKVNEYDEPIYDDDGNFVFDLNGMQIPLTKEMREARVTDIYGPRYDWALNNPNRGGEKDIPLTEAALASLERGFKALREAGGTCIISPSYAANGEVFNEPLDFEMILTHARQLSELITEYSDVIGAIEIRTIGPFGEMWGSPYCNKRYANRIIDTYLSNTPNSVKVMVRTPGYACNYLLDIDGTDRGLLYDKQGNKIRVSAGGGKFSFAYLVPYDNIQGLDLEKFKRISMFNDGYMLTNADTGTWSKREVEIKWLEWASQYGYYGGEYGSGDRPSDEMWLPKNALPEMYRTHVSYMHDNMYYSGHPNVDNWETTFNTRAEAEKFVEDLYNESLSITPKDEAANVLDLNTVRYEAANPNDPDGVTTVQLDKTGYDHLIFTEELAKACTKADVSAYYDYSVYTFIRDHIGYRFVVRDAKMTASIPTGGLLQISLDIENTGMANCVQDKVAQLVIERGAKEIEVITLNGAVNANKWLSQETSDVDFEVRLSRELEPGQYNAYLRVCNITNDGEPNTKTCVQFANDRIYNTKHRANRIGTFVITEDEYVYASDESVQVTTKFKDVADGYWGREYIEKICTMGNMGGMSVSTFVPEGVATRAQLVTVLYNMEGKPAVDGISTPLKDIEGWYNAAIKWAYSEGIVNGVTPTKFDPDAKLNRQTFATMIYRYAKYKGINVESVKGDISAFKDAGKVAGWALDAMKWANAKGYINGMTKTTLVPEGLATRAQMATILTRYIESL